MGLRFVAVGRERVEVYDARTGERLLTPEELRGYTEGEAAARAEAGRRAQEEAMARAEAERRVAELEARLRELQARHGSGSEPRVGESGEPEPLAAAIEAGDIQLIGGNPPAAELIDRFVANPDLVVSELRRILALSLKFAYHQRRLQRHHGGGEAPDLPTPSLTGRGPASTSKMER